MMHRRRPPFLARHFIKLHMSIDLPAVLQLPSGLKIAMKIFGAEIRDTCLRSQLPFYSMVLSSCSAGCKRQTTIQLAPRLVGAGILKASPGHETIQKEQNLLTKN